MIRFRVDGNPIPKARPRVVNGHAYTPRETEAAEAKVKIAARLARVKPLFAPVHLVCRFYRQNATACDLDNLTKLVSDALNGIAYGDDRQIVALTATKAIDRENPRTEVEVWTEAEHMAAQQAASLEDDLAGQEVR